MQYLIKKSVDTIKSEKEKLDASLSSVFSDDYMGQSHSQEIQEFSTQQYPGRQIFLIDYDISLLYIFLYIHYLL